MDSLEILLHLRHGEQLWFFQVYNNGDNGYRFSSRHMNDYCPNHYFINGVCPNCFYTDKGEPLAYLREKEIEDASIRL